MGLEKGLMKSVARLKFSISTRGEGKRGRAFADHIRRSSGWKKTPRSTSYVLDSQRAEMGN